MKITALEMKHIQNRRGLDVESFYEAERIVIGNQDDHCCVSEEDALKLIELSRKMSFSHYNENSSEIFAVSLSNKPDADSDDLHWLSIYTTPESNGRYCATTSYDRSRDFFVLNS